MLQHNTAGDRAHVAHAAVVGLHAVCCGAPLLALTLAAMTGATSASLLPAAFRDFHALLHGRELWIVALSALLVLLGGVFELRERRWLRGQFPILFAVSVACFALNLAIVLLHRLA